MKKYSLLLVIFLTFIYCYSQPSITWQRSLGGTGIDVMTSIQQTYDGGYIIAGHSNSNNGDVTENHGGTDYWVIKLTNSGSIDWKKSFGGTGNEIADSIVQTTDGGYIIAGTSSSNNGDVSENHGSSDYWIVKLNSIGVIDWEKSFGGTLRDEASCIIQTTDGGYIIAGQTNSNNGDVTINKGGFDYWVVKLNSMGVIEWERSFGGTLNDYACSIQQTIDGGYIVAGDTNSNDIDVTDPHGYYDVWAVKLTSTGTMAWQRSLGGTNLDATYSILQTADGGYIIAAHSNSNNGNVTENHGGTDYWVVKLTNTGDIDWKKSFGGTLIDEAYSIQQTSDGGYIVAGFSNSNNGDVTGNHGDFDYWVLKLSVVGDIQWQKSFGGTGADKITSIKQTADGGYAIAGYSNSNNNDVTENHGDYDYWIVKLSSALSTNESTLDNLFSVYPNPINNELHVNINGNTLDLPYIIYDQSGRSIMKGKLNEVNSVIKTDNLPKGVYILSIGDKVKTNRKIIKE
ncbi:MULTISPECIES: T9SS type A sorting domain-containing protein [Flavobacterium]|uniref:T9SS type A sorting domain-containing protein n=1 Tax=Flavobacterium TaxID=237 RepID=UPI001FCCABD0|nr:MULTISPECIES: T9SS type A sorting domain-containing protein [Flavobacterium]UOK41786.1 T9SS type A sorting domain-containing protein [Flavobacterium enshiense]